MTNTAGRGLALIMCMILTIKILVDFNCMAAVSSSSSSSSSPEVIVCSTGVSKDEEEEMKEALHSLSLSYRTNLNYREATHLVVKRAGTEKHKLALQKGLICVSIDWVYASRDKGAIEDPSKFPVPVFTGLVISVTQISPLERERLQSLIEPHGGSFIRNLPNPYANAEASIPGEKCASHLIALKGEGEKFECAVEWKIRVCSPDWIDACIKNKAWVSEEKYIIQPCTKKIFDTSIKPKSEYACSQELAAKELQRAEADQGDSYQDIKEESVFHDKDDSGKGNTGDNYEKKKAQKLIDILPPTSLMKESEVFKGDIFFITGVDQEIKDYITRLIFTGWGKLHHFVHERITKYIVGPDAKKEIVELIATNPRGAPVVTLKYMLDVCGLEIPKEVQAGFKQRDEEFDRQEQVHQRERMETKWRRSNFGLVSGDNKSSGKSSSSSSGGGIIETANIQHMENERSDEKSTLLHPSRQIRKKVPKQNSAVVTNTIANIEANTRQVLDEIKRTRKEKR